jgi:hypothetical protein
MLDAASSSSPTLCSEFRTGGIRLCCRLWLAPAPRGRCLWLAPRGLGATSLMWNAL